jgi:hypothetical protein
VTCVAVDFTVRNCEDTPGLYYDHIGQVQLCRSEWKLVTYVNISKLETTYSTLLDIVAQTRAMSRELTPEAISACQSNLSQMNQSGLRIHRTRRLISEITKHKEEEMLILIIYVQIQKSFFLSLFDNFPKFYSVHCHEKTPIIIKKKYAN